MDYELNWVFSNVRWDRAGLPIEVQIGAPEGTPIKDVLRLAGEHYGGRVRSYGALRTEGPYDDECDGEAYAERHDKLRIAEFVEREDEFERYEWTSRGY